MNIKKLIAGIMAVLAAVILAVTFTACGSCYGDVNENDGEETVSDSQENGKSDDEYDAGGDIPGVEITVPKDEQ